MTNSYHISDNH